MSNARLFIQLFALACVSLRLCAPAAAQVDAENRPIAEVRIEGLRQVARSLVENQLRSVKGSAYRQATVDEDIKRLTRLGLFARIDQQVTARPDGTLVLTFAVVEEPILNDVRVVGNKRFSDQNILGYADTTGWKPGMVTLRAGDAVDPFLIDAGRRRIEDAYQGVGYYQAEVSVDEAALKDKNILIFRVREGSLVKVRRIEFEGNTVFADRLLANQIKSRTAKFIFRKGHLSREELDNDVTRLRDYYRDRGYLEAVVGRRVQISPDEKDAVAVFVIEEGPIYTVASIEVEKGEVRGGRWVTSDEPLLIPREQILAEMTLKVGDVYSSDKVRHSEGAVSRLYLKLGHVNMRLRRADGRPGFDFIYHAGAARGDVIVRIEEARPHFVGNIEVRGNESTKDRVILRELRFGDPGRRFDGTGIELTKRRLRDNSLFEAADVTILGGEEDEFRDVLVDVKEVEQTGSIGFGAAVSSDVGVIGAIDLVQRNFDWQDWPDDLAELFSGRAFRGAGQYFQLTLQPGSERNLYQVSFREPYMFDSNLFFDMNVRFFTREREDWDEQRYGGSFSIGQYFGDVWRAEVSPRFEVVDISDIDPTAPVDVFAVAGASAVSGLAFKITRDTTNSHVFPTQGSRWEIGIERVGAFGGDFDFTRVASTFHRFWRVDEDFFGRATVLSLRVQIGYILEDGEAPVFERFYAGGHRNFRGFDYRGVGPRGIIAGTMPPVAGDDPVGGDWLFLAGMEYNWPIYQEVVRGVVFLDTGTVQDDFGFGQYRVSIGAGVRLRLPIPGFASAPFAFDIAVPLIKEDGDDEQLFSFNLALPF